MGPVLDEMVHGMHEALSLESDGILDLVKIIRASSTHPLDVCL